MNKTTIEALYRDESRRVLATLIRLLGDFELAEEAMQDAFAAALVQWRTEGMPANPTAWLVTTGRFKAIDQIRRRAVHDKSMETLAASLTEAFDEDITNESIEDDRLRLIFTCCHPALSVEAQLALTLREVCGLATEEIAHAFLVATPTIAQRIVRAKAKIRDAAIPYEVPARDALPERLAVVLHAIYLVFNEGYAASRGDVLVRCELANEAIRLGRLLMRLLPEPEVIGLLALMLLQDARRESRTDEAGELVRLEDQDRTRWNRDYIEEGGSLVRRSLSTRNFGPYTLQAAIAAVHDEAATWQDTDWPQICGLYEALFRMNPSPVVALNQAVAISMVQGPTVGLDRIDAILSAGELTDYYLAHAARADLLRQLNHIQDARSAYELALALAEQATEQRYLTRQLAALPK